MTWTDKSDSSKKLSNAGGSGSSKAEFVLLLKLEEVCDEARLVVAMGSFSVCAQKQFQRAKLT